MKKSLLDFARRSASLAQAVLMKAEQLKSSILGQMHSVSTTERLWFDSSSFS